MDLGYRVLFQVPVGHLPDVTSTIGNTKLWESSEIIENYSIFKLKRDEKLRKTSTTSFHKKAEDKLPECMKMGNLIYLVIVEWPLESTVFPNEVK
jgi:hypothetical protein